MHTTTRTILAAAATAALALTAAACSGETGASDTGQSAMEESAQQGSAQLATAEFRVDGMTCGGCALATELSVKKVDGVASADAEYDEAADEGSCTVEYDPSVADTDAIAAAIEEAGFEPTLERAEESG